MDDRILRYAREVFKVIDKRLMWVVLAVMVVSTAVLIAGILHHPQYQTSITIYADHKNIIQPLLKGQAPVTGLKSEQTRIVKETMFSQRNLQQVVECCVDKNAKPNSNAMENALKELRASLSIGSPGQDYIQVKYTNTNPRVSYQVVNKITNLFIEQSAANQRTESKNAYDFIAQQVDAYKNKLLDAENKLKIFNAANTDGAESQVTAAIAQLQSTISGETVDIQAQQAGIVALQEQLSSENRYAAADYSAQVYRDQLAKLQAQLQTLRLNYRDDYPDIVHLKFQIQDLKKTIVQVENSNQQAPQNTSATQQLNPVYQQLSNQLADAKVALQTKKQRLAADQQRLQAQFQRRKRVAANQAELSQLTRDYTVNKGIYDDLLERKEKARISMTLNLAGQGLSYKVLEPASFPVTPTGLRFLHFAIAGPIIGVLLPLGIIVVFVFLDQRLRFPEELNELYPGIVLAILPERRQTNWTPAILSFGALAVMYVSATLAYHFI